VAGADFGLAPVACRRQGWKLLQRAASFKTRGAFTNLLTRSVPAASVSSPSQGGTTAPAVAYAAMQLKVPREDLRARRFSSPAKVERIRSYGADLVVGGERYAEALAASEAWAAKHRRVAGARLRSARDAARSGHAGARARGAAPDLDTVLVAVGGGGLIGGSPPGIAAASAVVGVEAGIGADAERGAQRRDVRSSAPAGGIAADSTGAAGASGN
jgi:threonine dehydratase